MKRVITFLIAVMISGALMAQNTFTYPITVGKVSVSNGQITLKGSTSGTAVIRVPVVAGTGTIFQLPATNGTTGFLLQTNGSGVMSWLNPDIRTRAIIADSLNLLRSNAIDGSTVYAPLYITDTVSITRATRLTTLALTDAGHWLSANSGLEVRITIPLNSSVAFPIGTVINMSMDSTAIVHVLAASGVRIQAEKDSVCINTRWGVATLVKRATNVWRLFGSITD
jgi:hypothetical protein